MRFPVIPSIFLLLLAISAAVIVPNAVIKLPDRHIVAAQLSAQSGIELSIAGDMRLRFLPRPQVILEKVTAHPAENTGNRLTAPIMVVDLVPLALLRGTVRVQGVTAMRADIVLKPEGGYVDFLGEAARLTYPRLQILDSTLHMTGLARFDPTRQVTARNISAVFGARSAGEEMTVLAEQAIVGEAATQFRVRLAAAGDGRRKLLASLTFGPDETCAFDGFLTQRASGWRADGELFLDSAEALTGLIQNHLPIGFTSVSRRMAVSGLVQADERGVRSENLEINALNSVFQSRLALDWSQSADSRSMLSGRLSTGSVNLDQIILAEAPADGSMERVASLWRAFQRDIGLALRIEATRFDLGGETGQNMLLAFDWQDAQVAVRRVSLDLPFRSLLLASGTVDLSAAEPSFSGSFSTRSTDALAAALWLGERFEMDASPFVEVLDENSLQRLSLVGDIDWSPSRLSLRALSGRLGDDRLTADIQLAFQDAVQGSVNLQFDRFDLADWGIGVVGGASEQSVIEMLFKPLNKALAAELSSAEAARNLRVQFSAGSVYSGVNSLGPMQISGLLVDRTATVQQLTLPSFNGLSVTANGRMHYDSTSPYGAINVRLTGEDVQAFIVRDLRDLLPFDLAVNIDLDVAAEWQLTGPDDVGWPQTKLTGSGRFGPVETAFSLTGPSRELAFNVPGQKLDLTLQGAASDIASLVDMPLSYAPDAVGSMTINLENESSNLASMKGEVDLQDDNFSLSGTVRRTGTEQRIEGALGFRLANGLPLLDPSNNTDRLSMQGEVQIVSDSSSFGFSGLNARVGKGTVTGEGVLALDGNIPKLNANLVTDGLDISWALPQRGKGGWPDAPMKWGLFARSNVDVELRGTATTINALTLDEFAARLKLLGGVLEAPQITGRLLGGRFDANLVAEGGSLNPFFSLQSRFTDLQIKDAFQVLYATPAVHATADGTLQLSGRGTSVRDMMASLNGDVQVNMTEGRFGFIDLDRFLALAQAETFSGAAKPLVAQAAGETDFQRGIGLVNIRDGQAIRATLDFVFDDDTPRRDARFDGQADFVSGDMVADMTLFPSDAATKLGWQISGDIKKPKLRLDATAFDRLPVSGAAPTPK